MEDLSRSGNYLSSQELDNNLEKKWRVRWWPARGKTDFPSETSAEVEGCQPFVTQMLQLFVTGEVIVILDNNNKRRKNVAIRSIPDPNAFKSKTIGNHSPDVVFYDGLDKRGTSAITLLGEVKSGGEGPFPSSEIGQVVDGMTRLMNKQHFRQRMYGFLTDGRRFLFLYCTRGVGSECKFHHSSTFEGKAGWQVAVVY